MARLLDRLRNRAAERFVGRRAELALIEEALVVEPPPVAVFIVHGPGGIGKTSLLERARASAAAHGIDSLRLDARNIEPTPQGLLRALGAALGIAPAQAQPARVIERWSELPRRLLLIDTFECLGHLEGWLRESLLPELPESTRVILASRSTPDPAWRTDPLWREGACVIALRNLPPEDCRRFLAARGVADRHHDRLIRVSTGHPLALTLLADVVARRGEVPGQLETDVVRQLARRFTAQAPSELHRRALEVCAHARVTTEALLADAVDREHARELFDWLSCLSFIEAGAGGLFPHDLVRDAIDDELHWRHRERHREIHKAVREHLTARVLADPRAASAQAFDVMYLNRRSPALQPFVDFRSLGRMFFEAGTPEDLPALRALMKSEVPIGQHARVERWWLHRATSAWAIRPGPRQLTGATLSVDLAALTREELAADPMFEAVWRALQDAAPPGPGDLQLLARWNLAEGGQRQVSAAMNCLQVSQFFQWVSLRGMGAFVICVEQPDHWLPMMKHCRFTRMAGCDLVIDEQLLGCYLHDWRREPVSEWIARMTDDELEVTRPSGPPAEADAASLLSRPDFDRAVRDALRLYHDIAALSASPLAAAAAVRAATAPGEAPAAALRRLLMECAQPLQERSRDHKFWRALELTYFRPAGSQELAAERLGLPFGTYRYQLSTGIQRVAQALWARERR
jgi:hypothetical protein